MSHFARYRSSFFVGLIYLVVTLGIFGFYQTNTLEGSINNHMLSSEMFGIPDQLKAHGLKPMYGPTQSGWDGQFYYYMSNDIFALKDTASHIDAPSYRYQRVGLSLYAKTVATLAGRTWVSPRFFIASYFLLILAATWVGSQLLARFGGNPAWILLWSLSIGTQVTLFNALPDASADAFLILALAAVFSGRIGLSVIPFAMSALSREVYALFPAFILLFTLLDGVTARRGTDGWGGAIAGTLRQRERAWFLVIPCLVIVMWQAYVVHHFHVMPSEQAHGILGAPLASWYEYLVSGLKKQHLLVGSGSDAYREAASLIFFLLVLIAGFLVGARILRKSALTGATAPVRGIAAAMAAFALLYACFGPTVMMHYSGYFKAIAVFFFLLPLLLCAVPLRRAWSGLLYLLLVLALIETSAYNLRVRILPYTSNGDKFTRMSTITETRPFACFKTFSAKVKVNSIVVDEGTWITQMFGHSNMVINVDLTNTSEDTFVSTKAFGSVAMGYHWVDEKNQAVVDGERSAISAPLLPGQTVNLNVYATYPTDSAEPLSLKLSPVQEGCTWFYLANPAVADGFSYTINHRAMNR